MTIEVIRPRGTGGAMRTRKNHLKKIISITTLLLGMASLSTNGYASTSDILENYQRYFDFVVRIGNGVDASSTKKMVASFSELKKRNPEAAARFLKGLRFELVDKAERMGKKEISLGSQNPEVQKWVGRFMREWAREADEHLYRVYSTQIAKK
ncbi:MAG: hypothetical protein ACKN9V_09850 [Pseudomonadota bacterium]